MIGKIKGYIWFKLVHATNSTWNIVNAPLSQIVKAQTLERINMERYAQFLLSDFDTAWSRVIANKKCMIIKNGDFAYSYFNVAYVNNVLSLIFYALYRGCVPVIHINQDRPFDNKWDWYFKQPFEVMNIDISNFEFVECDILNHDIRPDMQMIYTPASWKYRLFRLLSHIFLQLNDQTEAYVAREIEIIGSPSSMLGVLMRGTDYIKLKPKGHPVQPEPEKVISRVADMFSQGGFEAVYVATEEKRLYDMVGNAVGWKNVRENKRQYYDKIYYQSDELLIGKVRFDRENDNYLKGLEYLSSLMILSKCQTLVAGNCGGTLYAMLLATYRDPYIFNYGVY